MAGDRTALDEVMARQEAEADDEDRQFSLFAPPLTEAGMARSVIHRRGRGRPPGARNKRTIKTVAMLLSRHRNPLEVLLEIAETNVADLAALYDCSLLEAGQEKRLAAIAALPYVAQRQPLAIDITQRRAVYLTITDGDTTMTAAAQEGPAPIELKNVEYQWLPEGDPTPVERAGVERGTEPEQSRGHESE